jgi:hypothetical protein
MSSVVMQNAIMMSVFMLIVVMLSVIMLNAIMTNVFILNVIMPSVIMLNVVAPSILLLIFISFFLFKVGVGAAVSFFLTDVSKSPLAAATKLPSWGRRGFAVKLFLQTNALAYYSNANTATVDHLQLYFSVRARVEPTLDENKYHTRVEEVDSEKHTSLLA